MQRYFVKNNQINNSDVLIEGNDFHHIKNVMRMRINSEVLICDEDENTYQAVVRTYYEKQVLLEIIKNIDRNAELNINVTIAFGMTRSEKQEEVLRRITELGASGFLAVEMERSIVRLKDKNAKIERMKTIVKEASEQSHRSKMMEVYPADTFLEFIEKSKSYDYKLFAYEEEGRKDNSVFKAILKNISKENDKNMIILVGPEGGISDKEVKILLENNFLAVGLGPRILRCETAPLYIMSAISYELELKQE